VPERGDDAVGDDRLEIVRDAREGIEADRPFDIGRVDLNQVVASASRDLRQHRFREVAVRIEKGEAFAGKDVLPDEVEEERALAGAGLPDDVQMSAAFLEIEHGVFTRRADADANLLA
jgi:hypothetical protein